MRENEDAIIQLGKYCLTLYGYVFAHKVFTYRSCDDDDDDDDDDEV